MLTTALVMCGCPPRRLVHRPGPGVSVWTLRLAEVIIAASADSMSESLLEDLIGNAGTR